jgi:hypothetical protein
VSDRVEYPVGRQGIAVTVNAPADFLDTPRSRERGGITLLFDRRSGNLLASRLSARVVEAPLTGVRYRHRGDHVTVIHAARFTDHLG